MGHFSVEQNFLDEVEAHSICDSWRSLTVQLLRVPYECSLPSELE